MLTFVRIAPLRSYLKEARSEGRSIGLVPTMGALHEGHLSLMRRAVAVCDVTVATIFVNPTQFGPNEDLTRYPRPLDLDMQLASNAGVSALFTPSVGEMYPDGSQTMIVPGDLAASLEGSVRPGHFSGVATVVAKLLNIAQPDQVFFGQKDYQQLLVIERLVRDLNIPTTVVMAPTVREADGLALSSRNVYLGRDERRAATVLFRALSEADLLVRSGITSARLVRSAMESMIGSESLAALDYAVVVDSADLRPVEIVSDRTVLAAVAVRIGKTRLIDNMLLTPQGAAARSGSGK